MNKQVNHTRPRFRLLQRFNVYLDSTHWLPSWTAVRSVTICEFDHRHPRDFTIGTRTILRPVYSFFNIHSSLLLFDT